MKKAIILAAGFGTRMMPLTRETPKAMIPLWGKPLIGHTLDMLARWKITEVLINLHHAPNSIFEYVKQRNCPRMRVCFSYEPKILGTGGAVRNVKWFTNNQPFWIINADIAADIKPAAFINELNKKRTAAVLWLHHDLGPRTVEMQNGKISSFKSKHPATPGTYTFCGIQLVSPNILEYLPNVPFSSIISAYETAILSGKTVRGICPPNSYWIDIGTPERYVQAHLETREQWHTGRPGKNLFNKEKEAEIKALRRSGISVKGFAAIGHNVNISKGVHIHNSIIWDNTFISAGSSLSNAVIGKNADVNGSVSTSIACRADSLTDTNMIKAINELGWPPHRTTAILFGKRGSQRTFTRLIHDKQSAILICYSPQRKENCLYANHARFLRRIGIKAPEIIRDIPRRNMTLIEDLKDLSLTDFARTNSLTNTMEMYKKTLDLMLILHSTATTAAKKDLITLQPSFSHKLYKWEHDLFAEQFLAQTIHLNRRTINSILNELHNIARTLKRSNYVLVHRDFQSSNVLITRKQPAIIDFQGMRMGPPTYDLASLLCDPYVALPAKSRNTLMEYYMKHSKQEQQAHGFFWPAAIQRLTQAIGAFARFDNQEGLTSFRQYIKPALRMMKQALKHFDNMPCLNALCDAQLSKHS